MRYAGVRWRPLAERPSRACSRDTVPFPVSVCMAPARRRYSNPSSMASPHLDDCCDMRPPGASEFGWQMLLRAPCPLAPGESGRFDRCGGQDRLSPARSVVFGRSNNIHPTAIAGRSFEVTCVVSSDVAVSSILLQPQGQQRRPAGRSIDRGLPGADRGPAPSDVEGWIRDFAELRSSKNRSEGRRRRVLDTLERSGT